MNQESELFNQSGSEITPLSQTDSQLERLKTKINELKEDILNAGVELSEAPSGAPRAAAQKKLKDLNDTHAALALALSNITEEEKPKGPSRNAVAESPIGTSSNAFLSRKINSLMNFGCILKEFVRTTA
jgi:hypothetical protein